MRHLSGNSLFSFPFLHSSITIRAEITEESIHALCDAFQSTGVHHLIFHSKTQGRQVLLQVLELYRYFCPQIAHIEQEALNTLEEVVMASCQHTILLLESSSEIEARHILLRTQRIILDLFCQNTISIILVSYTHLQ